MNAEEVDIIVSIINSTDGWIGMDDLVGRFRRQTSCKDESRSITKVVEATVALLGRQSRVETAHSGARLLARKNP